VAAYAFALAISASSVTSRQHFPSDVLVGAAFGYLIGGYVVRHQVSSARQNRGGFGGAISISHRSL
jgi:hypothetical protein